MSNIDENEVWAFLDEAGAIFTDATGRDLNDFDGDDDWQECCLKFFREMADELKKHGVTWDREEGYKSTITTELEKARGDRDLALKAVERFADTIVSQKTEIERLNDRINELGGNW